MIRCYIGLGGNQGPVLERFQATLDQLSCLTKTYLSACSSVYQSTPMGVLDQPDYLNAVVALNTLLSPIDLLSTLQAIEKHHGRNRAQEVRWGQRPLDLDILLYGQKRIHTPSLRIPHPGLRWRPFVCIPLYEIAPTLYLPSGIPLATHIQQWPANTLNCIHPPLTMQRTTYERNHRENTPTSQAIE